MDTAYFTWKQTDHVLRQSGNRYRVKARNKDYHSTASTEYTLLVDHIYRIKIQISTSSSTKMKLVNTYTNGKGNLVAMPHQSKKLMQNEILLPVNCVVALIVDLQANKVSCEGSEETMQIIPYDTNLVFICDRNDVEMELFDTRCWVMRRASLYLRKNNLGRSVNALPASLFRELIYFM